MNIDIRKSIINNFKNASIDEIRESINDSLKKKDEITLPGMGVLFEILWEESENDYKQQIIELINSSLKKRA